MGFVQLARDSLTGNAVAIKFVEREHPSLAAGLLLREIGNQVCAQCSDLAAYQPQCSIASHLHIQFQFQSHCITLHHCDAAAQYATLS